MPDFDCVIIGSGIGGGTAARALGEAGHKVLVLEAGEAGARGDTSQLSLAEDPEERLQNGAWPDRVEAEVEGRSGSFHAPLGCGIGGTSVFYAATLERPSADEIGPIEGGISPGWPLSWPDLAPWYDEAQRRFQVCGSPDPLDPRPCPALRPPPALSASDQQVIRRLEANGMHPYRLHSGTACLPGCQSCYGRKCPLACKMDGRSAGIEPALATGNVGLLTRAAVTRFEAGADQISGVDYQHQGRSHRVSARHVILAAGAYASPGLLRASVSQAWPQGIGNRHDLVGRRLMFHYSQRFMVWPGRAGTAEISKTLAFRDFYRFEGQRLGMVQSMGIKISFGEMLHFLRMGALGRGWHSPLIRQSLRIPAWLISQLLGNAALFDGQMEDFPSLENRLIFSPEAPRRIAFHYSVPPEAHARRAQFRRQIRRAFRGMRPVFLSDLAEPNLGHPCGTLGMGHSPETSVTDARGRIHGMKNLWIADASAFATSMAVNPSLTIAALALRQARAISETLSREQKTG